MMFDVAHAHIWKMVPHTYSETKWAMNVREPKHTAMAVSKRYYDVDTGKFDSDRIETLYHSSLSDVMYDCVHNNMSYGHYPEKRRSIDNFEEPKIFIPKDDDFDEECRLDEERIQHQQEDIERQEELVLKLQQELKELEDAQRKRLSETNRQYIITWSGRRTY